MNEVLFGKGMVSVDHDMIFAFFDHPELQVVTVSDIEKQRQHQIEAAVVEAGRKAVEAVIMQLQVHGRVGLPQHFHDPWEQIADAGSVQNTHVQLPGNTRSIFFALATVLA